MIELQPFRQEDFSRLMAWVNADSYREMVQWAGLAFQFPLDEPQLERYLLGYERGEITRRRVFKAVDSDTVVGHIELNNIDPHTRRGCICRVMVAPEMRGHGYGQHMLQEMLRYSFTKLKLRRVDLYVFDFNAAAIACYQRVGFRKIRYLRDIRLIGDDWWSAYHMMILRREWGVQRSASQQKPLASSE